MWFFRKIEERIGKFEMLFDQMQIDNFVIALVSSFPFLLY